MQIGDSSLRCSFLKRSQIMPAHIDLSAGQNGRGLTGIVSVRRPKRKRQTRMSARQK